MSMLSKEATNETGQKVFLFADKESQLKRANRFLVTGYLIYYVYIIALVWTSLAVNVGTALYAGLITGISVMAIIVAFVVIKKKKMLTIHGEHVLFVLMEHLVRNVNIVAK